MDFKTWLVERVGQEDFKFRTQQEIADLLDISLTTYSEWHHGKKRPANHYLWRLAKVFGVDIHYLFKLAKNENSVNFSPMGE